ncbi:hypothetical protein KSP39_PZI007167 [Platanthera zijinensis]|uniref:DUF4378 domain-containing protein n=1 Tax=Platanthera zijinensis TaxID=2320716 RepID=A0AAP0G9I4_9ASPA
MGPEKGGPKSRGFLQLFDWNRKSRKKLFSVSPESAKQEKRTDDSLPGTKLRLLDEDETIGISSMKGSSEYSCSSSVTDEEGGGIRALGIVARLMGLNSMPASGFSEPFSTPRHNNIPPRDKQIHKIGTEFYINDQFNSSRVSNTRKPAEFRTQKMPSSPIERFQTETLPPRSAKSVSLSHHKLLSPIKTPGFIPPRNAAHIMEAAANIFEPTLPVNSRAKASSPYGTLKIREPKNRITGSQRTSNVVELARRSVETSDVRYLKGQSLNRSWNGSEDTSLTFKPSPDMSDTHSLDGKGKGKSVSLAIQAKVNVQMREGMNIHNRNAPLVVLKDAEGKSNQPFKIQQSNQKYKQQKVSFSGGSSTLRQNNQKQNCLSGKSKITPKQSVSNQQGRKIIYRDNPYGKKNTTKIVRGSRVVNSDDIPETCSTECEGFLSKEYPQKKRLIDGDSISHKNSSLDNIQVVHHHKHVLPNVLIDEQLRWSEEKKNHASDVVSFTFTSPLVKSTPMSPSSILVEENSDKRNIYKFDSQFRKNNFTAKKLPPQANIQITGDTLSILLEQKFRELTSGNEASCYSFESTSSNSCPVQLENEFNIDSMSTSSTGHNKQLVPKSCRNQFTFSSDMSTTDGHMVGLHHKPQELEAECSSITDARNEPNLLQPSPLSILDISFSSESCNSSAGCTEGSKISLNSSESQNIISSRFHNKFSSFEMELDLSDSASSSSGATSFSSERQLHANTNKQDLEYVREILKGRRASSTDLVFYPLNLLFNKLEKKRGRDRMTRSKVLLDCISECLDDRCNRFFRSGYRSWAIGEAMTSKDMAEEIYAEILRWKGFSDCMVDELVDVDMSSHRGRWIDFEIETFELGEELEKEIISSFINEVVTDCFHVQV